MLFRLLNQNSSKSDYTMKDTKVNLRNGYLKDNRFIYFHTWTEEGYEDRLVKEADYTTFSVIKWEYAKDKNNVYYYGKKINGADVSTFQIIKEGNEKEKTAKDKNFVYWHGVKLKDADPKTFQLLEHGYKKDKKHIYINRTLINNADPESFRVLTMLLAKDIAHVYYGAETIKNSDTKTFEHLKNLYSRDKSFVYSRKEIIKDADRDTFQVLGEGIYAKDKAHVYSGGDLIQNADVETFEIVDEDNWFSKDKYNDYYYNKKIGDDGTVDIDVYPTADATKPSHTEKMEVVDYGRRNILKRFILFPIFFLYTLFEEILKKIFRARRNRRWY